MKTKKTQLNSRFRVILMTALFSAFSLSLMAFSGGDGTSADPFQIASTTDLVEFSAYANNDMSYYVLTADIDMDGVAYTTPANISKAYFDGVNHIIENLTITANSDNCSGLIGIGAGAQEIKNLGLVNVTITSGKFVGALVGKFNAGSGQKITNCFVTGSITSATAASQVGGLVGKFNNSTNAVFENCFVDATISGVNFAGGLFANSPKDITVTNCVFYGTVAGALNMGAITAGAGVMTLSNGYHKEGYNIGAGTYKDNSTTEISVANLATEASYGFTFGAVWAMSSTYAVLKYHPDAVGVVEDIVSNITYVNMDGVTNPNSSTYSNLAAVTLATPNDRDGYTFAGWYTDAAFADTVTTPAIAVGTTVDTTFYAKWDDDFRITSLTWEDGKTASTPFVQSTEVTVKIGYDFAENTDSLYVLVASNDDRWATNWVAKKIGFKTGETEVTCSFTMRTFAGNVDADKLRVFLGPEATSAWGARVDVALDAAGSNDAIYGTIVEQIVETVEVVTALTTDEFDANATPSGGTYAIGDSIEFTVNYNSTAASTFFMRLKSKDNVTKYMEYDQALPATTASTAFTFKVGITNAVVVADSIRIVGWIGSYSGDKEFETFIKVTAGTATRVDAVEISTIKVYPNPATSVLTVEAVEGAIITMFNASGVTVKTCMATSCAQEVSVSDLSAGIYFIKVDKTVQKVMIK